MILLVPRLRSLLVISAVLILLITPALVVSNVLAQRPQPPPPPPPGGEHTIVVVQLVQLVVVVQVTSQVTNVNSTVLILPPAATSPPPLLPSTGTGLVGMDAIGLLTGSIAMLAAAVYLTSEGIKRRKGLTWLNPQPEPPSPEGLRKIPVSDSVHYQYREQDGKTSLEGLVTSERLFPGVFVNKRFYYGLHNEDRFLPGIISGERFIPGLLTSRGFLPGLATDEGFTPGIIATGAFVPGIVHNRNFVPGIVSNHRFIPGSFTFGREFVPGRFQNGRFETGRLSGNTFAITECEKLSPEATRALPEKGVGISDVKPDDPVGGLPIRGVVVGAFDLPAILPLGMITNEGVVIGGMYPGEHYGTLDPGLARRIPSTQDPKTQLGGLGINEHDPWGISTGWNSDEKKFGDKLEKEWNDLLNSGFSDNSLFGPVDPNRPGSSGMGRGIGEALGFLGQGDHGLIDGMNKGYDDMMKNVFANVGMGGVSEGGQTGDGQQKGDEKKGDDEKKGSVWETIFGVIGAIVGAIAGAVGGGVGGAVVGGSSGYKTGQWIYQAGDWCVTQISGGKKGGGTKDEDDDTGGRGDGYTLTMRGYNPAIMHVYDPGKRVLVNWQQSGEWGPGTGDDHSQGAVINWIITDTGRMPIINYEELGKLAKAGAAHAGQVSMGMNPITGEVRWVSSHPLTPEEQKKHELHDLLVELYMNPVSPPLPDYGGKAPAAPTT